MRCAARGCETKPLLHNRQRGAHKPWRDARERSIVAATRLNQGISHERKTLLRQSDREQPVGHLSLAGRPRRAVPRPAGPLGRNLEAPQASADRRRADRDGRRHHRPLRGLPRAAQHEPRPGQGRRALPPRRHARRSDGAVGLDDHQDRGRQPAVRRRQGRHPRRPQEAVAAGAGKRSPAATPARSASSSARTPTSPRPTSTPTARSWRG